MKGIITKFLILVTYINSLAELDKSKLKYCSKLDCNKFRAALIFESEETHPRNRGDFYLNFNFWIGFSDLKGLTHYCSLIDSTKEIQIRVIPDNKFDSVVTIVLDSNGMIKLAFVVKLPGVEFSMNPNPVSLINSNFKRANKLIYYNQGILNATDSEIEYYKSEINFIGDYIGVIPGNKFKKYLLSKQDSIGRKIKKRLLSDVIHMSCDKSMMGKLIVRPISNHGSLRYEQVLTPIDANNRELKSKIDDFVFINPSLNESANSISRIRIFNKDSLVKISYSHNEFSGGCFYEVIFNNKNPQGHWVEHYYCKGDGEVNNETSGVQYVDNLEARDDQARVDKLIKYFK